MNKNITTESIIDGLILPFDKPYRWTSFDLVNKVRKLLTHYTGIKKLKVGHAGTLDPLATGLLLLCTGSATKKIVSLQDMRKTYEAEITLGASTPSFDLESQVDKIFPTDHISLELIKEKLIQLTGKIQQEPPLFSAKKFNGVRAYELARSGVDKRLNCVEVEIFSIDLINYEKPILKLKLVCSKGTYIRSLARDLGSMLQSGGYLSKLRRIAIGDYSIDSAWEIENFKRNLNFV
jgi:tRNA pseudouridine55 synthase